MLTRQCATFPTPSAVLQNLVFAVKGVTNTGKSQLSHFLLLSLVRLGSLKNNLCHRKVKALSDYCQKVIQEGTNRECRLLLFTVVYFHLSLLLFLNEWVISGLCICCFLVTTVNLDHRKG